MQIKNGFICLVVLLVILAGCTTTPSTKETSPILTIKGTEITQYKCYDGSFVDNSNECPKVVEEINTTFKIEQEPSQIQKPKEFKFEIIRVTNDFNYENPSSVYITKNNLVFFKKIEYDSNEDEVENQYVINLETGEIKKLLDNIKPYSDFFYDSNLIIVESGNEANQFKFYKYDFQNNQKTFIRDFSGIVNCDYGSFGKWFVCSDDKIVSLDFSGLDIKAENGLDIDKFFVSESINTEIFLYDILNDEKIILNPSKSKATEPEDIIKRTIELVGDNILIYCENEYNLKNENVKVLIKSHGLNPVTFGSENVEYTIYDEDIPDSWRKWITPTYNPRKSFCGIYDLQKNILERRDDYDAFREDIDEESLNKESCAKGLCLAGTHEIRSSAKYGEIKHDLGLEKYLGLGRFNCTWYPWINGGTFVGKFNGDYAVWVDSCIPSKEFNEISTKSKTDIFAIKILENPYYEEKN